MCKISDIFYENIYHIFLDYCNSNNMFDMKDLDNFDFNKLRNVKGIGVSKIEAIKEKYNNYIGNNLSENIFSLISKDNLCLSISTLSLFGISKNALNLLLDSGISTIDRLIQYGHLNLYKLNSNVYNKITKALENYKTPLYEQVDELFNNIKKEESFDIILKRANGVTLNKIGNEYSVTRERIRQIETVKLKQLKCILDIVISDIVKKYDYKSCVNLNKLDTYFKNYEDLNLMRYTVSSVYKDFYLDFCNKLMINGDTRDKVLDKINGITEYYIKDIVNFNKKMVVITESLYKNNIPYIDIEDLTNYLLLNGYIKKGNYIFKSGISYGLIGELIVKTHFKGGIKIHDNNDIEKLRKIVKEEFGNLDLPDNNRALGARISSFLILCDRGCYTVKSNIKIADFLLTEIRDYISRTEDATLFFNDLYVHFYDKLLKFSNVKNRYFLQGVLKHFYEDEFVFERDSITKLGREKQSMRTLIAEFVRINKRPVHRREIKEKFPGATEIVITNAQISNKDILQWEYNYYIHSANLDLQKEDKEDILSCLNFLFDKYKGYASEQLLYDLMLIKNKNLLIKNHIKNPSNLFYLASYLYKDKFMFRRPHILSDISVRRDLSSKAIVEKFLFNNGTFKYTDYQKFVTYVKWSIGTTYAVFKDIEKEIVRISEDEYVNKERFNIEEEKLIIIFNVIEKLVKEKDFVSISKFNDYKSLPDIGYKWNSFILASIVNLYLPSHLKLIVPTVEDRRYVKEIVVSCDFKTDNYEQFIIEIIKKENLNGETMYRLESYLSSLGLIGRYLPKELYNSKNIYIEDDRFYTI